MGKRSRRQKLSNHQRPSERRRWKSSVLLMNVTHIVGGSSVYLPTLTSTEQTRIVGGTDVAPNAYPYLAFTAGPDLCGATLIWSDILLSAGHCQDFFGDGALVGGILLNGADGEYHEVDSVLVHPDYPVEQGNAPNDIMLVKLSTPSSIATVPLATDSTLPAEGQVVKIMGYGATSEGGLVSPTALEAAVTVVNFADCSDIYSSPLIDTQFCTSADSGKDTCQGDSGGPIFDSTGALQVGVVSFGEGCARISTVNSKVSSFSDFIQTGICKLSDNPPASCNGGGVPANNSQTKAPTNAASPKPTSAPVKRPTIAPVKWPTIAPVKWPTIAPVKWPTIAPVKWPTIAPWRARTQSPTQAPTNAAFLKPPTYTLVQAPVRAPSPPPPPTHTPVKIAPTKNPSPKPTNPQVPVPSKVPEVGPPSTQIMAAVSTMAPAFIVNDSDQTSTTSPQSDATTTRPTVGLAETNLTTTTKTTVSSAAVTQATTKLGSIAATVAMLFHLIG